MMIWFVGVDHVKVRPCQGEVILSNFAVLWVRGWDTSVAGRGELPAPCRGDVLGVEASWVQSFVTTPREGSLERDRTQGWVVRVGWWWDWTAVDDCSVLAPGTRDETGWGAT